MWSQCDVALDVIKQLIILNGPNFETLTVSRCPTLCLYTNLRLASVHGEEKNTKAARSILTSRGYLKIVLFFLGNLNTHLVTVIYRSSISHVLNKLGSLCRKLS